MTTAAAANDETEILEQRHATRATAAAKDVAAILEQKLAARTAPITNEETEILQQSGSTKPWEVDTQAGCPVVAQHERKRHHPRGDGRANRARDGTG